MRISALVLALAVFAAVGAVAARDGLSAAPPVVVKLKSENRSGQVGTATIVDNGDSFVVMIKLTKPKRFKGPLQTAHIHNVSCADYRKLTTLDEQAETATDTLEEIWNGRSRTVVYHPLANHLTGGWSINTHVPSGRYPATTCGDLPALDAAQKP